MNFNVIMHHDLRHSQMMDTISDFKEPTKDDDLIWFYFTGHSKESKRKQKPLIMNGIRSADQVYISKIFTENCKELIRHCLLLQMLCQWLVWLQVKIKIRDCSTIFDSIKYLPITLFLIFILYRMNQIIQSIPANSDIDRFVF